MKLHHSQSSGDYAHSAVPGERWRWLVIHSIVAFGALILNTSVEAQEAELRESESKSVVSYDQVRGILRKRCVTCHNPDELRGDLNLADLNAIRSGSSSGPVVVPGKPNQSLLFTTAAHLEDPTMPPNSRKIPTRELDILRRWIEEGLADKADASPLSKTTPLKTQSSEANNAAPPMEKNSPILQSDTIPKDNIPSFNSVRPVLRPTSVTALAAHPSKPIVAFSGNQQVVLLNPDTGSWLGALDFPEGDVTALRYSQDGRYLVAAGGTAGLSGTVVGFDVATGQRVFELADETDTILSVDISPNNEWIALGGPAKVVRVYSIDGGQVRHTLRKHTDWVMSVRFSPDGLLLASSDRFGGLFVWEADRGELFHELRGHVGSVRVVAWDHDAETLLSAGTDATIRTWNMHHGQMTSQWNGKAGPILALARRHGITTVGGRDQNVMNWIGPGQPLAQHATSEQIECVAIVAGGKYVVAGDAGGNIWVLDTPTGKPVHSLSLPIKPQGMQQLLARVEDARSKYEELLVTNDASPSDLLPQSTAAAPEVQGSDPSPLPLLAQEIERTNKQLVAHRQSLQNARESADTVQRALEQQLQVTAQLQQVQASLVDQANTQQTLVDSCEQHLRALQAVYQRFAEAEATGGGSDRTRRQAKLQEKLDEQMKVLQEAVALQQRVDQLSVKWKPADVADSALLLRKLTTELQEQVTRTRKELRGFDVEAEAISSQNAGQ